MTYLLAIDYGTTFTCAAIRTEQRTDVLRIEGRSHFPSHVYLHEDGQLWLGAAGDNAAGRAPERFVRSPKRWLGSGPIQLGDHEVDPRDAAAAVLRLVLEEAARHQGGAAPSEVRLTYPAGWGASELDALEEAAARADIASPALITEPEAAVHHFAASLGAGVRPGDLLAVYDLGGGTFDAAVLRCVDEDHFELAGPPGGATGGGELGEAIGGEGFDRRVYEFFGTQVAARDPEAWAAIDRPCDRRHRQAHRTLLNDAHRAKEALSTLASADAYVAIVDTDVAITREQFEELIAGDVRKTVALLDETLTAAGIDPRALAGLYLTGGSSRIPLVQDTVRRLFGRVDTQDDPKAIVALGAASVDAVPQRIAVDTRPERVAPASEPRESRLPVADAAEMPDATGSDGPRPSAASVGAEAAPARSDATPRRGATDGGSPPAGTGSNVGRRRRMPWLAAAGALAVLAVLAVATVIIAGGGEAEKPTLTMDSVLARMDKSCTDATSELTAEDNAAFTEQGASPVTALADCPKLVQGYSANDFAVALTDDPGALVAAVPRVTGMKTVSCPMEVSDGVAFCYDGGEDQFAAWIPDRFSNVVVYYEAKVDDDNPDAGQVRLRMLQDIQSCCGDGQYDDTA